MTTNTPQEGPLALPTPNGPHTDTNASDFRIGDAIQQAPEGKAVATKIACLALAGHAVHQNADGGFLVCKYGMTHYAKDLAALQAFAKKLGVSK